MIKCFIKTLYNYNFIFFSVNVTDDGKSALLTLAKGDMRKTLNILQVNDTFE